jgi:hypothetical protein
VLQNLSDLMFRSFDRMISTRLNTNGDSFLTLAAHCMPMAMCMCIRMQTVGEKAEM